MNKFIPIIVKTVLLLFPLVANANWVEVTGKSYIENDNVEQARKNAIDDALLNADYQYGVYVSKQYEIVDGKLVNASATTHQRSQESTDFELFNEKVDGDELTVEIRVFVDGRTLNTEPKSLYKSRILVPQTTIAVPEQLTYGQINHFGNTLSQKISDVINKKSKAAYTVSYSAEKLDFFPSKLSNQPDRLPQWLGIKTEAQYVLIPEILDVSVNNETSFGLFSSTYRQFNLKLSLYHAISGEKVWRKAYQTRAQWKFARNEIVSTHSTVFWGSEYGEKVSRILRQAARDIGKFVTHRPLMAQIIAKKQNQLLLNVGRNNGLHVNDSLNVILKRDLPDRLQAIRLIAENSSAKVVVKQLTEDTALVDWEGHKKIENVQVGDIAITR